MFDPFRFDAELFITKLVYLYFIGSRSALFLGLKLYYRLIVVKEDFDAKFLRQDPVSESDGPQSLDKAVGEQEGEESNRAAEVESEPISPRQIAIKVFGGTREYDEAKRTGTPLMIPAGAYYTKLSKEGHENLKDVVKASVEEENSRERADSVKKFEEAAQAALEAAPEAQRQAARLPQPIRRNRMARPRGASWKSISR